MHLVRSVLFTVLFYLNTLVWLVAILPTLLMPRHAILRVAQAWGRAGLRILRATIGTEINYRGLEHIPRGGLIVAAKHQSFADVLALLPLFDDPTFVLKRELTRIPLWGWFALKARMIPVDRAKGGAGMAGMIRDARREVADGRQILIYPEGTRRPPGAPPAYKTGVAALYEALDVPCLPVAVNSGVFWPRRSLVQRRGTIVIEFLPPIPPGLDRDAFMTTLRTRIEAVSDRLLAEAADARGWTGPEGI